MRCCYRACRFSWPGVKRKDFHHIFLSMKPWANSDPIVSPSKPCLPCFSALPECQPVLTGHDSFTSLTPLNVWFICAWGKAFPFKSGPKAEGQAWCCCPTRAGEKTSRISNIILYTVFLEPGPSHESDPWLFIILLYAILLPLHTFITLLVWCWSFCTMCHDQKQNCFISDLESHEFRLKKSILHKTVTVLCADFFFFFLLFFTFPTSPFTALVWVENLFWSRGWYCTVQKSWHPPFLFREKKYFNIYSMNSEKKNYI